MPIYLVKSISLRYKPSDDLYEFCVQAVNQTLGHSTPNVYNIVSGENMQMLILVGCIVAPKWKCAIHNLHSTLSWATSKTLGLINLATCLNQTPKSRVAGG